MSRQAHRRRSGKSHRWLFVVLALMVAGVATIMLAPVLVMNWVRGYLQEEAFRGRMEQFFGTQLQGRVELEPLRWTGDEVTTNQGRLTTASGWQAEVNGLHLALDWNAFRQGIWRIIDAGTDDLTLSFTASSATSLAPASSANTSPPAVAEGSQTPAWLQRWLPNRSEIDGIKVERLHIKYPGSPHPWLLRDSKLRVAPWKQETSWQVSVQDGVVETPILLPGQRFPVKLNLSQASARLSREELSLKEAVLHWMEPSEIVVRGQIRPAQGSWKFTTHLTGIPLNQCVSDDWKLRLAGQVEGDLETTGGSTTTPRIEGDLNLKEGVLTALPILDELASYTKVERFKRLVLDIASTHVRMTAGEQHFEKIILQSNGLLRLEGSLVIRSGQLEGNFLLGVTPETLKWMPGAQNHVFTLPNPTGPAGMVWTTLRVTGPISAPKEDLSNRLLAAAGKAVLEAPGQVIEQGSQMLLSPILGKEAGSKPGEVLKGATDAAGGAIGTGVKVLEGIGGGLFGR